MKKFLLCMISKVYYLSYFQLGILLLSVENILLDVPKSHGHRRAVTGMTLGSNSPFGAGTRSLTQGWKFFPRSPGQPLIRPKIGWNSACPVVNDKARLRKRNYSRKESSLEN